MTEKQLINLLNSLTLEQKLGQLFQVPSLAFDEGGAVTGVTYLPWLEEDMIELSGSVLNIFDNKKIREIQKKHLEKNPVPLMFMADIINGYKTVFPSSIAQACSFNPELAQKACEITAYESSKHGLNVTLSPMVDVSRDARWGRISEGYGESTLLNVDFGVANVKGYQGKSLSDDDTIAACVKHFVAYGATQDGRDYYGCEMSERTLRSTYLPSFKACVDAGVKLIMPAFNTINGVPCTVNEHLMKDILRDEWGFNGVVISDYGAIEGNYLEGAANSYEDCAKLSIDAGVHIDMIDHIYMRALKNCVEKGYVSEERIDELVLDVLKLKNEFGLFEDPYKYVKQDSEDVVLDNEQYKDFTKDFVAQSTVLLKNEDMLPLKKETKTAFIGPFVFDDELMTRWSMVTPHRDKGISINQALNDKFGENKIPCVRGCKYVSDEEIVQTLKDDVVIGHEEEYLQEAIETASKAENVVLVLGEHKWQAGECHSRSNIKLSKPQIELFNEIYKVNKNITVIIFSGRPLAINEISDKAKAILFAWYPGTFGAQALVDMVFGDAVPSGKLAITMPRNVGQCPIHYERLVTNHPSSIGGRDRLYCVRYIDVLNTPLYPFGYGLSYTTFEYSKPVLNKKTIKQGETLEVSVDVKNTGEFDALNTVQLYINDVAAYGVSLPPKILKAYKKDLIKKGESKTFTFKIDEDMLKYYDNNAKLVLEKGKFEVYVGDNSDTENKAEFELL